MNARVLAQTGRGRARRAANGSTAEGAARAGLTARGVIYLLVGVLALQIAFGTGNREADRGGALAELADKPFGAVLLWALGAGLVGMALWRLSEALFGATGKDGHTAKKRLPAAARCVFYAFVAYSVLAFAAGSGGGGSSDRQSRDVTAKVMEMPAGQWIVGLAGAGIVVAGVVIAVQALRRSYHKKLKLGELSPRTRRLVDVTGVGGERPAESSSPWRAASPYAPPSTTNRTGPRASTTPCAPSPRPRSGPGCWSSSPPDSCCSASSPSPSPAGAGSEPRGGGTRGE